MKSWELRRLMKAREGTKKAQSSELVLKRVKRLAVRVHQYGW